MKDYNGYSEKANELIWDQKIEASIKAIETQIEECYLENFREAVAGEEGLEEDLDSSVENPSPKKKQSSDRVVITDDTKHAEELEYDYLVAKRRLFDSVCREDVSPIDRLKVFKALIS